jgi:transcriptional regulator with XRE-family HTH domain
MTSEELKAWRYRNRYSQTKLARALNVDVMTVSRWERNVRHIPPFLHLALERLECMEVKEERDTKTEMEVTKNGNDLY